jgi:hypothetical protein
MADVTDFATVIVSRLKEVSVNGVLQVSVDGSKVVQEAGGLNNDDAEVLVTVVPRAQASD